MSIIFDKGTNTLTLNTKNSSYQMKIDAYGFLLHSYYGAPITGDMSYRFVYADHGFSGNPYDAGSDRTYSHDALPQEYPFVGNGDFRSPAFAIKTTGGTTGCDLHYVSHEIAKGKYAIAYLPTVYDDSKKSETLLVTLADARLGIEVVLSYGVFYDQDLITRAVTVKNVGTNQLVLQRAYSVSIDLLQGDYDLIYFHGRHGHERLFERSHVGHAGLSIGSRRGTSSHQHNPFVILADQQTNEDFGACYGVSLLYSGNFTCEAQRDQYSSTRLAMGLQGDGLDYCLPSGQIFHTPEVMLIYSDKGLTDLSHKYHHAIRHNVCRGSHKLSRRPIVINSWEAAYFDFDGDRIFTIAKEAHDLGVEMIVLDDGWFGQRSSDNSALGDWFVNEKKLGGSLHKLVSRINDIGMDFGLWIEPEMVNEDSDLYRAHPDWAFTIPGKKPVRSRNQLVLDFSRNEVVEHIFSKICTVLDGANVSYIKMDMNRSISDVYTAATGHHSAGSILYRYTLGVYNFLERLMLRYPNLLIEGCSGGGGRFDAGMLYYTPQIWCSDNTDAIERIAIQYGTSFGYPISSVGSHVSCVPNHQTGRVTDMATRAAVAMAGSFGYELDLKLVSDEEKKAVTAQIADYKKYWSLIHNGLYYRLTDCATDTEKAAWLFVAEGQKEALLTVVTLNTHCNPPPTYIKCKGLNPTALYQIDGKTYSGSALMGGGLPVPPSSGEYKAWQAHLTQV